MKKVPCASRLHFIFYHENYARSRFKRWQPEAAQCLADLPGTFIISYVPSRIIASSEEIIVCITSQVRLLKLEV